MKKNEGKEQKGWFIPMISETLDASIIRNELAGKRVDEQI